MWAQKAEKDRKDTEKWKRKVKMKEKGLGQAGMWGPAVKEGECGEGRRRMVGIGWMQSCWHVGHGGYKTLAGGDWRTLVWKRGHKDSFKPKLQIQGRGVGKLPGNLKYEGWHGGAVLEDLYGDILCAYVCKEFSLENYQVCHPVFIFLYIIHFQASQNNQWRWQNPSGFIFRWESHLAGQWFIGKNENFLSKFSPWEKWILNWIKMFLESVFLPQLFFLNQ